MSESIIYKRFIKACLLCWFILFSKTHCSSFVKIPLQHNQSVPSDSKVKIDQPVSFTSSQAVYEMGISGSLLLAEIYIPDTKLEIPVAHWRHAWSTFFKFSIFSNAP